MESISDSGTLSSNRLNKLRESVLSIQVREFIASYVALEEFYLEENVKKAIEIDKLVSMSSDF